MTQPAPQPVPRPAPQPGPQPAPTAPRLDRTAMLLLCALATVWGGSFFFAQIALREVPPLVVTLQRVVWAALILGLVLRLRGKRLPRDARTWGAYLVMGALNNAIPFSLIFWGQTRIDSSLAAILNGTTALFGVLAAAAFFRDEPLTPGKLAGALIGLLGIGVIVGPGALAQLDPVDMAQMAVVLAALSYACASVWGRKMLGGQDPVVNAFGMLAGSSVLMLPLVLAVEGVPNLALHPATWAALLSLAALSTALAYLLYFAILRRAGAANLMLVTLMIPPVAICLGVAFLGERLSGSELAGFGIIALGLLVTDGRAIARLRGR